MKLEDLEIYKIANEIGELIWQEVSGWNQFEKDTIGRQVVRSADSIAANISESFGRFHYGESRNFLYYSRGSLSETKTWIEKANRRTLITDEKSKIILEYVNKLSVKLNNYIKTVGRNVVEEPEVLYTEE